MKLLTVMRVTFAGAATLAAALLSGSTALTLMLLYAMAFAAYTGLDGWLRAGSTATRGPATAADPAVLIVALGGVSAWAISRLAEWELGAEAGPGAALLLMIYLWIGREALARRRAG